MDSQPVTNDHRHNGSTVRRWYESPIDNALNNLTHYLNPTYRRLGVTPVILFGLSWVCAMTGLWLYERALKGSPAARTGVLLYFLGYFFNRAEGNLRRTDHLPSTTPLSASLSDLATNISLMYVLLKVTPPHHMGTSVTAVVVLGALSVMHSACEEDLENAPPECRKLRRVRLFGWGTLIVVVCMVMLRLKG